MTTSETTPLPPSGESQSGKPMQVLIVIAAGAITLYLLACIIASTALTVLAPIAPSEIEQISWLVTPPVFGPLRWFLVLGLAGITLKFLLNRSYGISAAALIACTCTVFGLSPSASARFGILEGDARIGCYTYESLECRKMLGESFEGARSIYEAENENKQGYSRYASWYQGTRRDLESRVKSVLPSSFPYAGFLSSPHTLLNVSELNVRIRSQRDVLATFRANMPR
ncbi:hypothetical protein QO021_28410 (plasmid) [Pseudomonas amygdali pv. lachrymans]|uniref:hypothetical protein n=1 Tax=Pseudomonas amygdali TaxID=47877 RepID=UPI000AA0765F|nr:hypothetical protein [Pseudomonas amygdali]RMM39441.1 hypothetical protein ALQ79_200743 [Pseudomonas amygdali pv. lachrymans]WIO61482.1 hypothetical protein QO021_28410 [Pseudomonas amygdali pv. lachrymans]